MNVLIAGASGLIGRAATAALRERGHRVTRLVRNAGDASDAVCWQPAAHVLPEGALDGVDAVLNLAGENISAGRWSRARRERLRGSRIETTRTLIEAMARRDARPTVLVNASAVGFYGDRGDAVVTEATAGGGGFLAEVCAAWEREARAAEPLGVRVIRLRFGIVLSAQGGALGKMVPLFRTGLGGRLGSGRQWVSWVHVDDVAEVVIRAIEDPRYAGALNVVAPHPVTNGELTEKLAAVLRRPAWLPAPAWALRLAWGALADEALLGSTRAVPARLETLGYTFRHPHLADALRSVVGPRRGSRATPG